MVDYCQTLETRNRFVVGVFVKLYHIWAAYVFVVVILAVFFGLLRNRLNSIRSEDHPSRRIFFCSIYDFLIILCSSDTCFCWLCFFVWWNKTWLLLRSIDKTIGSIYLISIYRLRYVHTNCPTVLVRYLFFFSLLWN